MQAPHHTNTTRNQKDGNDHRNTTSFTVSLLRRINFKVNGQ